MRVLHVLFLLLLPPVFGWTIMGLAIETESPAAIVAALIAAILYGVECGREAARELNS